MANKKPFQERIKPDSDKLKNAALPALINVGMAVTGGMIGTAVGWHSLYLGALAIYAGQYSETNTLTALGAGMFASVPFDLMTSGGANLGELPQSENKTLKTRIETGKVRALAFKDAFAKKMFLDKLFKKKGKQPGDEIPVLAGSLEGLGYLGNEFANLDQLRDNLVASAMDYQAGGEQMVPMLNPGNPFNDMADIDDIENTAQMQTMAGLEFDDM